MLFSTSQWIDLQALWVHASIHFKDDAGDLDHC